jgi:pimeloyl-ACP methyl ester carboxylesterase
MDQQAERREPVVLVHGLWLGGWVLAVQAARLRHCGYDARTFSYPSVRASLAENADRLARFARSLGAARVHFVGHSMGGAIILKMLQENPGLRGGRVVLAGSPYGGSRSAEAVARWAVGRMALGRSVPEWLRAPRPDAGACELGIVAGCRGIGLGRLVTALPAPNDGVVVQAETRVPGMADFISLQTSHTEMLWSRKVSHQLCAFLRTGQFDHRGQACR